MAIEEVRLKTTLKCGDKVFKGGTVFRRPFPPEINTEITKNTGTVEILLEVDRPVENAPVETPREEVREEQTPNEKSRLII